VTDPSDAAARSAPPSEASPAPAASPGGPPRAWRSSRAWIVLLGVLVAALALDLASKRIAFATLADQPVQIERSDVLATLPSEINRLVPREAEMVVIPYVLRFELVLNPGAVFGMGPGKRWFFIAFTGVALAFGLWVFARWTRADQSIAHVAIAFILAGGIGNLYDRLAYGCVRDFLHPLYSIPLPFGLSWPGGSEMLWPWVSNVADALLLIGIVALLMLLWREDEGAKDAEATRSAAGSAKAD